MKSTDHQQQKTMSKRQRGSRKTKQAPQAAPQACPVDPREFIFSLPPPPAVHAEALLKELEGVVVPEQVREFILQHRFPPIWGQEMEAELRGRLRQAGFSRIRCRCVAEHPVVHLRMSKAPERELSMRQLMRLLRNLAQDLGQNIPRDGIVASITGNRAEAAVVLDNPEVLVP